MSVKTVVKKAKKTPILDKVKEKTQNAKLNIGTNTMVSLLPPLLMVGSIVGIFFAGRKILKGITSTAGSVVDFIADDEQNVKDSVENKEILKATISATQARRMAQGLYDSMVGTGTNEDRILGIFNQIKNKADYLAVHKAFGLRPYESWFSGDDWLSRKISPERHLAYWLKSEISKRDSCYEVVKKWVTIAGFGW